MKRIFLTLTLFLLLPLCIYGQTSTTQPTSSKQEKFAELNRKLKDVSDQIEALITRKREIEAERDRVLRAIADEQVQNTFMNSPAVPVMRVIDEQNISLLIGGREQSVQLLGVYVTSRTTPQAKEFLKRKLTDGWVYVKCGGLACNQALIYLDKKDISINAQMVAEGLAVATSNAPEEFKDIERAKREVEAAETTSTSSPSSGSTSSGSSSAGKEVHVKGYYRKDGTYVRPHTRSAPKRKN
jgi:endonuclease YncB( thermonuclease family)